MTPKTQFWGVPPLDEGWGVRWPSARGGYPPWILAGVLEGGQQISAQFLRDTVPPVAGHC